MEDINPNLGFIEVPEIHELETQLNSQLKELCERNDQLARRNAELRASAEIGWNAEVQFKKFGMIEADLTEQIQKLRFERDRLASSITDKEKSIVQLKKSIESQAKEIQRLQTDAARLQQDYDAQIDELARQLSRSRANEAQFAARITEIQQAAEQTATTTRAEFESKFAHLNFNFETALSEAESLKMSLAHSQATTKQLEKTIAEQEAAYRHQLTELAQSGWKSEREMVDAQKSQGDLISELARQKSAFEKTVSELRRALESERTAHSQVRHRESALRAENERLEETNKTLSHKVQNFEEAKRKAISESEDARIKAEAQLATQKATIADMSHELNQKIRDAKTAQDTIQQQMTVIGEQSRAAEIRLAEMGSLRAKANSLQNEIAAQVEATKSKDQTIDRLTAELGTKDELIQRQLRTLSNMAKVEKEKDLEIQRLRFTEISLLESVTELKAAGKERDVLRRELEAHASRLANQLAELESKTNLEIISLNTQLQSARAQTEAARAAHQQSNYEREEMRARLEFEREEIRTQLTAERDALRANLEEEREDIRARLTSERDAIRQQLEAERENNQRLALIQDDRATNERAELERLKSTLEQREYQLRHYAASVSDEKAEVLRRAKALAEEIKAASTLAPLKDYLALTEFELSKVEAQLRKTPVISVERPRLEANYGQMIEQRDFLKKAITSSQQQLDLQAAQLLKIAKPDKLAPIPPLPPRRTSVQSSPEKF